MQTANEISVTDIPLSSIDTSVLDGTLLLDTVRLFAVVAGADNSVTEDEKYYVRHYVSSRYTPDIAAYLFDQFNTIAHNPPDVEGLIHGINRRLVYRDKIFLLVKLYELMAADDVHEDEVKLLHKIARLLRINSGDLAVLDELFGISWESSPEDSAPVYSVLRLRDNPVDGDVLLPFPDLSIDVVGIHGLLFITQRDDNNEVFVAGVKLHSGFARKINRDNAIIINRQYTISYQDLKLYFRNLRKTDTTQTFYVVDEDGDVHVSESNTGDTILDVAINGSLIQLVPRTDAANLIVKNELVDHSVYVNLNDQVTIKGELLDIRSLVYQTAFGTETYTLQKGQSQFVIGNRFECDLTIDDEGEEAWTCSISREGEHFILDATGCPYAIYKNDHLIKSKAVFSQSDAIRIDKFIIRWNKDNEYFEKQVFGFKRYAVDEVNFQFTEEVRGIDGVSFEANKGDLVCVMGPSGSGKSTLLKIMNGLYSPHEGEVHMDSYNLHVDYNLLKGYLGYVPQDDLLLENLTVYENLFYNARLRYPNKSKYHIDALVNRVLDSVELFDKSHDKVGSPLDRVLSGGERKRLNIGLELLADSEVLFLDEPTSGLSSKDSEKIVEMLRKLAQQGKIIFAVIHQPNAKIYRMFSKVILLDKGGHLAFFGDTFKALEYFKVYSEEYSEHEIECPECKNIVPDLLLDTLEQPLRDIDGTPLKVRKYSAKYWKEQFANFRKRTGHIKSFGEEQKNPILAQQARKISEHASQFLTLLRRNFKNKLRDRSNVLITFFVAPLLGLFVSIILRYSPRGDYTLFNNRHLLTFIFLAIVISIFLGMTNSVEEIIKDANILIREKMLRISSTAYLISKSITLFCFAIVQNILFLVVSMPILGMKELYLEYLLFLSIVSMIGVSVGLLISSIPGLSSKAAINIVPIILVPQIIFGGGLIQYEQMNKALSFYENDPIPPIADAMASRWAFEGMVVLQGTMNSFHPEKDAMQDAHNQVRRARSETIQSYQADKGMTEEEAEARYELEDKARQAAIDNFRKENEGVYGNRGVNLLLTKGQRNPDDRETMSTNPFCVTTKKVPFLNIPLHTTLFNGIVLVLFIFVTHLFTLVLLRFKLR